MPGEEEIARKKSAKKSVSRSVSAGPVHRTVPQIKSPIEGNRVDRRMTRVSMPSTVMLSLQLENAAAEMRYRFADSDRLRKKRLKESEARYDLQSRLSVKEQDPNAPQYERGRLLDTEDAMKLGDEELVEHYNEYRTEDPYLAARYSLLRNRYYTLLPVQQMKEIPKEQLMNRLKGELARDNANRNTALIIFLQDLITVKNLEENAAHPEIDDPEFLNRPEEITAKERGYNDPYYKANERVIDAQRYLGQNEKQKHKDAMKSVMQPDDQHQLWQGKEDRGLNSRQKEGARQILAWMYRNCNKSSETKEPFVYRLTQAPPEKLILMLYLIENKMSSAPGTECFYKALNSYTPDLEKFKDRVVASKWKFWKRIGPDSSDRVIDWSAIGQAWHFVMGCDFITEYAESVSQEKRIDQQLRRNPGLNQKHVNDLCRQLVVKGNILRNMYKGAGLTEDMSPELISSEKLRKEVMRRITDFRKNARLLRSMLADPKLKIPRAGFSQAGRVSKPGINGEAGGSAVGEGLEYAENAGGALGELDRFLRIIDGDAHSVMGFTDGAGYIPVASGLAAVTALAGFVNSIFAAVEFTENKVNLRTAERVAQGLAVSGDNVRNIGEFTAGTGEIIARFVDDAAEAGKWLGNTTLRTAGESFHTVAGGVEFVSGAFSIAAGLASTVSGAVEFGSAVGSRRKIRKGREKLSRAEIQDNGQLTESQKAAMRDQQRLKKLMTHTDRMAENQKKSAGARMASGVCTMIGGVLNMTGVALPVGMIFSFAGSAINIGYNVLYARHLKHMTQRAAVDDALELDQKIRNAAANDPSIAALKDSELEEFKNQARQEFLARNGYATFKECYADIASHNARMLYRHIFSNTDEYHDQGAYEDVVKALGFKIKRASGPAESNIPTPQMIYSKLMK